MTLSQRIAALTGPDRAVDAEVAAAIGVKHGKDSGWSNSENGDYWVVHECAPAFTADLNAAMSVVPEGWTADVRRYPDGTANAEVTEWSPPCRSVKFISVATPALALLAAAIKARGL